MKFLSEQKALTRLSTVISDLRSEIAEKYEYRAKSCMTCETQGACCLDAHFVNVHISRLEAVAIGRSLSKLPIEHREAIKVRVNAAIEEYSLTSHGDTFARTYACPLFEKGVGCLVHKDGKPVPCIVHACYERADDLPPDEFQAVAEDQIGDLNLLTYGRKYLMSLPLALRVHATGLFSGQDSNKA